MWIMGPGQHQLRRGAGGRGHRMPSLRVFSGPWQLWPVGSSAGVARPLASQEPWPPRARERGTVRVLSRLRQLACRRPRAGPLFVGAAALNPTPGWGPQALADPSGAPLLGCRLALTDRAVGMLHPLRVTQPVALPPRLPGSAPQTFPPRPPLTSPRAVSLFPSTVGSRPHPGVALQLPATAPPGGGWPCPGCAGLRQGLPVWFSVPSGSQGPGTQASVLTLRLLSDMAVKASSSAQ